jgi:hypothetical protein
MIGCLKFLRDFFTMKPAERFMNKIRFSDEDANSKIETASSRSSKTKSVLLTPFSTQEYELATAITDLMEHIASFPQFPANAVNEYSTKKPMKPSQALIKKASYVAAAVKKLSTACGDVFANVKSHSLELDEAG